MGSDLRATSSAIAFHPSPDTGESTVSRATCLSAPVDHVTTSSGSSRPSTYNPTSLKIAMRPRRYTGTGSQTAQTYTQVTKFKFFGRATTGDTGAVAKNLLVNPTGVAPAKDLSEGAVDLNGALFAACLADQTAAAGSPATNNLSAFTYGILNEVDTSLSLSQLSQRVGARLDALNMSQTPIAQAPPMHPELLTDTFITMQEPGGSSPPSPGGNGSNGFDPYDWLRRQLGIAA
jgi:hypothetical protein